VDVPSGNERLAGILSIEAAVLYRRLLQRGPIPLEQNPSDPAVTELLERGFAAVNPEPTRHLLAIAPDIAIGRALSTVLHRWLDTMPRVEAIMRDLQSLSQAASSTYLPVMGDAGGWFSRLTTPEERCLAAVGLFYSARREVWLSVPSSYHGDGTDADRTIMAPADLLERGVAFRFLYDDATLGEPGFLEIALKELDMGAEARVTKDRLLAHFMIVDQHTVYFTPEIGEREATVTASTLTVTAFKALFERLWHTARTLQPPGQQDKVASLSTRQREVLALVVNGRTNDAIARTLDINRRTVSRHVEHLLEIYGADDRLQLAAMAMGTDRAALPSAEQEPQT
jgi:DNA-binding CsgD family transcriptional regulator